MSEQVSSRTQRVAEAIGGYSVPTVVIAVLSTLGYQQLQTHGDLSEQARLEAQRAVAEMVESNRRLTAAQQQQEARHAATMQLIAELRANTQLGGHLMNHSDADVRARLRRLEQRLEHLEALLRAESPR